MRGKSTGRPDHDGCYLPELEVLRGFVDRLGMLFEPGQGEAMAWGRHAALMGTPRFREVPELATALTMLGAEKFAKMIAFLKSPACRRKGADEHATWSRSTCAAYEERRPCKWRRRDDGAVPRAPAGPVLASGASDPQPLAGGRPPAGPRPVISEGRTGKSDRVTTQILSGSARSLVIPGLFLTRRPPSVGKPRLLAQALIVINGIGRRPWPK